MKHIIFIIVLFLSVPALAQDYTGKVVSITDGDTLTVLIEDNQQLKIRLAAIDTPEKDQPFGRKSKDALSSLVFGKQVKVQKVDVDRYKRTVAHVFLIDPDTGDITININKTMVASGAAWVYRKYNEDQSIIDLETMARKEKRGLWALPEAERMPPWEWRKTAGKTPAVKVEEGTLRAFDPRINPRTGTPNPSISNKSSSSGLSGGSSCCKICRTGKACGNTCISVDMQCNSGPGCAC